MVVAGQPLNHDDIITYILAGLNHEYDSFVASISARTDDITLEEIYSLLLTFEARLSRHQLTHVIQQPSTNIAYRQYNLPRRGGFHDRGCASRGGYNSSHKNHDQPYVVCQICGKIGHSTKKCYFRFDLSYQEAPPLPTKQGLVAMRNNSNNMWDSAWNANTGATHHFTNDANTLTL